MRTILTFAAAALAFALGAPDVAFAQQLQLGDPCADPNGCVENGSDYFATQPGTFAVLPGVGSVNLMGVPIGGAGLPLNGANIGNTDTIVQRTSDIQINGAAGPLVMEALQLESTGPVAVPGLGSIPIFISLQCNTAASCAAAGGTLSTGTMAINRGPPFDTFNSSLDVFFDVCTAPGVNGVGCGAGTLLGQNSVILNSTGSPWSPTPGPSDVIVPGGDCNNLAPGCDAALVSPFLFANDWTGLDSGETNFFPGDIPPNGGLPVGVSSVQECNPGVTCHVVDPATVVPEPASLALFGSGFLALVPLRRRRRRS